MSSRRPPRVLLGAGVASALLAAALLALPALVACAHSEAVVRFEGVTARPLVADDPLERSTGLQGHDAADAARGMLFVWSEDGTRVFAEKDVAYPLDLVFIDGQGRVVDIATMAPDGPREASSANPARHVLEIEAGWAADHGIGIGDAAEVLLGR